MQLMENNIVLGSVEMLLGPCPDLLYRTWCSNPTASDIVGCWELRAGHVG